MDGKQRRRIPKLDRRNAVKNFEYEAYDSFSSSLETSSLDRSDSFASKTSFRIEGVEEGEFDRLCHNLGLSGPEDFAIPVHEWEARRKPLKNNNTLTEEVDPLENFSVTVRVCDEFPQITLFNHHRSTVSVEFPIDGIRSPVLAPPPSMSLPVLGKACSTWEILRSLAPEEDCKGNRIFRCEDEESEEDDDLESPRVIVGRVEGRGIGELSGSAYSFSTSNDDDCSSTTTEAMVILSPDGSFRRSIRSWIRGDLLGSGSFGTVYEGISDGGYFFAIKEVSLLDQGNRAQQCIHQLEHEIALLSQFEHENIVQYLGTDKEEAKLYIFLELVTKGSLLSLYQKYHLRDSQVSVYTRQILNGLNYLHDRNVVHRDIKCANILVDASGSVKLADFGLAKETSKINMLKSCKGSAHWMAPEVVNPRKTYGPAADIWSLGCTVLEMLTRQVPYAHLEWTQAIFKIGRGEPPPMHSSLSRDARDFIIKCLQVIPENRPSASDLLNHPFLRTELPSSTGFRSSHNNERRT